MQAHCFATSVFASAGSKTRAHAAPMRHTFRVQRAGSERAAVLAARGDMAVHLLKRDIVKKLALNVPLANVWLHLATDDGSLFTVPGRAQPVKLDSLATVDEALEKVAVETGCTVRPDDKLRIIVRVAALAQPSENCALMHTIATISPCASHRAAPSLTTSTRVEDACALAFRHSLDCC